MKIKKAKRILVVVTDYGDETFEIIRETEDFIETNNVTLFEDFPIRFNKKEGRLEYLAGKWDVYVPDDCIFQVETKLSGDKYDIQTTG